MRGGKKGKHCGSWLEFQMEDLPDVPGCNTHLHAVAQCEQCVCKKADWLEVSVRTDHMELWGGVHHQICGLKICPFERSRMQTLRCSTNGFTAQKKQTWQISFEENWHANALKNRNTGSSSVNTHSQCSTPNNESQSLRGFSWTACGLKYHQHQVNASVDLRAAIVAATKPPHHGSSQSPVTTPACLTAAPRSPTQVQRPLYRLICVTKANTLHGERDDSRRSPHFIQIIHFPPADHLTQEGKASILLSDNNTALLRTKFRLNVCCLKKMLNTLRLKKTADLYDCNKKNGIHLFV